jgi:molybdopterin converting factor small subunit
VPTYRVQLFAHLKDRHGAQIEVESAPTVSDLLAALEAKGLAIRSCRLSVNRAFATPDCAIEESDELALIPPVSGG